MLACHDDTMKIKIMSIVILVIIIVSNSLVV